MGREITFSCLEIRFSVVFLKGVSVSRYSLIRPCRILGLINYRAVVGTSYIILFSNDT